MKKTFALSFAIMAALMFCNLSSAQEKDGKDKGWQDRMKAEKIAFLTDAMDLSPAEAEKFWPVYNQSEAERRAAWKLVMDAYKALEAGIDAGNGDKEIKALLDKYLDAQEAGNKIDRKYVTEYRKILSNDKIARLYMGEERFRRQQIHKLNKNDNGKNDKK